MFVNIKWEEQTLDTSSLMLVKSKSEELSYSGTSISISLCMQIAVIVAWNRWENLYKFHVFDGF